MGSKGGAAMSPAAPSSLSLVVCCMCGDYGLPRELFRCKVCLTRSQHKYCSNLYPKAENYRACNWCLRDEGGKTAASAGTVDHNHHSATTDDNTSTNSGGSTTVKLNRGAFPLHLHKPVKKQRPLLERSASEVIVRTRSEELSPASAGKGRPVQRGKVRRYKLLEEVSS